MPFTQEELSLVVTHSPCRPNRICVAFAEQLCAKYNMQMDDLLGWISEHKPHINVAG